jgi:Helix-turn-helix domain
MMPMGAGPVKSGLVTRAGRKVAARNGGPMSKTDERVVYKPSEVARALDLKIRTVHKLIHSGDLLAIDIRAQGSSQPTYRITRASFEAYLLTQALPARSATGAR